MTDKEKRLHKRLLRLWSLRRATHAQIMRCIELDRKALFAATA